VPVDVMEEIVIERPVAEVAAFAGNPDNATRWYVNIKSVEWKTAPPLAVGSRVAFVAAAGEGRMHMSLRNRGEPSGFSRLLAPFMARALRRANRKDLQRLKALLEGAETDR
jgi:hypothetical protein